MEIDLNFIDRYDPRSHRLATRISVEAARLLLGTPPSTRRRVEGESRFEGPVILASNHTHVFDFLPLWVELLGRGQQMVGWVKARMYKSRVRRGLMALIGNNAPLVSRGYLIAADFRQICGRPPTDEEYRHLRDCVDGMAPLPEHQPYVRVASTSRNILGRQFDPRTESYARAMRVLFCRMMQKTLKATRRCTDDGYHLHIYPEGMVGRRLTRGHPGVIQAAIALDLPIVPVGISRADRVFVGKTPLTKGGEVRLVFGEQYEVNTRRIGDDFEAFHPDSEHRYRDVLQAQTDVVMARLNELVDDEYRFRPRGHRVAKKGVERFYR